MSRLSVPNLESDTGPSGQIYAQIKKAVGNVPNTFAVIGAHGPAKLKAVLAADAVLAAGTLSKRDQETIKLVISGVAGCDYCVAAHSLLGKLAGLKPEELKKIRDGAGPHDSIQNGRRLLQAGRAQLFASLTIALRALPPR